MRGAAPPCKAAALSRATAGRPRRGPKRAEASAPSSDQEGRDGQRLAVSAADCGASLLGEVAGGGRGVFELALGAAELLDHHAGGRGR